MNQLDDLIKKFESERRHMEDLAHKARNQMEERLAKRFLALYRKMLAQHDTHRHEITISSGMGTFVICIDGEIYYPDDCMGRKLRFPIGQTLNEIYKKADYDWMWCLDGERLN
jgi:hypothetical protein